MSDREHLGARSPDAPPASSGVEGAANPPRGGAHAEPVGSASDDGDLDDLKMPGPLRRNSWLLAVIVLAVLVGPMVSRFLESYRAVVLDVKDGKMLVAQVVAQSQRAPKWVDASVVPGAQPGEIIEKELASWSASVVEARGQDHELVQLHARYARTYEGVIVRIDPPVSPSGASTAVIELDGGGRERHALWAEHLSGAAVGRRVRKVGSTWDPILTHDDDRPAATLGPGATPPQ